MKHKQTITDQEMKFLVSYYYVTQEERKRFYNQERALDNKEVSMSIIAEFASRALQIEKDIKKIFNEYTKKHIIGEWIRSVVGLGPVLTAGILSYIDITKVNHAGSIWVYAGINAEAKWKKGEKRPWNQHLKNISWKIGDSFNKNQDREECYYGKILRDRKKYEWTKNLNGDYIDTAKKSLAERNFKNSTNAYQWYSGQFNNIIITDKKEYKGIIDGDKDCFPMLPPAHIVSRIYRYAVKRFYSDLYVVWHETFYKKKAPLPYVIVSDKFPEHTIVVEPYNYISPYK